MSVIYYDGDQLALSTIEPQDEPRLRTWINDPEIWSTLGMRRPINAPQEAKIIEQFNTSREELIFGIYLKSQKRIIGTVGVHRIDAVSRRGVIGILIGEKDAQNAGYGTQAMQLILRYGFREMNLHRILLHVLGSNDRAIHVYEKVGFVREGTLRDHIWRHGRWHDVYVYGMLESEWSMMQQQNKCSEAAVLV
ncbi:MAG: GNAT family N-acetyltransferase [Phycisphaeraceae bacterium JB051]